MNNSRNLLLAFVLSAVLILTWDVGMNYFYPQPETPIEETTDIPGGVTEAALRDASGAPVAGGSSGDLDAGPGATGPIDLETALASEQRVAIDAPRLAGSINLVGARIDDVVLKDHRESTQKDSGPVRLFAPERTPNQYFAEFGFLANAKRSSSTALWSADGATLTPETPVTLTRTEGDLAYAIKLSVDDNYMINAEQSVTNTAEEAAAVIQPFALINRTSVTATPAEF
ncbi:MAG: membrane protein insertase YidC, partial [Erythrobacter sp.]|nr:membrane protein insertase YidC [Erythrobacter sp.]